MPAAAVPLAVAYETVTVDCPGAAQRDGQVEIAVVLADGLCRRHGDTRGGDRGSATGTDGHRAAGEEQRGVGRARERESERAGGFGARGVQDGHADVLDSLAGDEGQRAARRGVVRAGLGRAVRGGVPDRHRRGGGLPCRAVEEHWDEHRARRGVDGRGSRSSWGVPLPAASPTMSITLWGRTMVAPMGEDRLKEKK